MHEDVIVMDRTKVIIMGAAGRDFHNFNTHFRDNDRYEVVAFTATQIPFIEERLYPPELAGKLYPDGIRIFPEEKIIQLIKEHKVEQVIFAYSDLPYSYVMHMSSIVNAAGADFILMGTQNTMIKSTKPLIAVCAVRTGCGKSQTSRALLKLLRDKGHKVVAIRHPMPYDDDLNHQAVERLATYEDLDNYRCTIEEREEYEKYVDMGAVIYAGVDYEAILREAEKEADIIIWDGGNNDFSFYHTDLFITVTDPHRAGHESSYYPGEVNMRLADIVLVNKVDTADQAAIDKVTANSKAIAPNARIILAKSPVNIENGDAIKGQKVLVVEDGPTLTHGGMEYGAGFVAAKQYGAGQIIDPRPFAVGTIKGTFDKFPHLHDILPAMGYSDQQVLELEDSINKADTDHVVVGTPFNLGRLIKTDKHLYPVTYELGQDAVRELDQVLDDFLKKHM